VVFPRDASASQVAFKLFKQLYPVSAESAECWYAALLSDTRYFTTSTVDERLFETARELVLLGADPAKIAINLTQRRSLSS
jgi:phosphoesterase RecJ-like protein